MSKQLISIIIRTKNEERWIANCINKIFSQKKIKYEIIIVDNNSSDKTIEIAKTFKIKILKIKKYKPGKALNIGIKKAKGSIIVCLSAHCIPCDDYWLYNLTKDISRKKLAGIYGRQVPLPYSSDNDKRDLLNTFGLDRKIQRKDSFFHNACSAFKKSLWNKYKFDERLTNIEDRVWAHSLIKKGFHILYEPKASVFHWHGIHQDLNTQRSSQVVKILESLGNDFKYENFKKIKDLNINVIIPHRGLSKNYKKTSLLQNCVDNSKKNKLINNIYVFVENKKYQNILKTQKNVYTFLRPKESLEAHIDLLSAAKSCLNILEDKKIYSDYIIVTTEMFPNKEHGYFDKLVKNMHNKNYDLIFPVINQKGFIWKKNLVSKKFEMIVNGFQPTKLKNEEMYISRPGYGFIIRPELLRAGNINSNKIGYIKISNIENFKEI